MRRFYILFLFPFLCFSKNSFAQVDTVPPYLECKSVAVNISNSTSCWASVYPSDVIDNIIDNVTPVQSIELGLCFRDPFYLPATEGCNGSFPILPSGLPDTIVEGRLLHGENIAELWAKDQAGNVSICTTSVYVQDLSGGCDNFPTSTYITGNVSHTTNDSTEIGVKNVFIKLLGNNISFPIVNIYDITDHLGYFNFSNVPLLLQGSIWAEKQGAYTNGVNTYDLLKIQKHLLGNDTFVSPYQLLAADANGSGSITPSDIIELRKLILGIYNDSLPNSPSWRFTPKSFTFTNPANPFLDSIPFQIQLNYLQTAITNANFEATKIGDLDDSADYNFSANDDRSRPVFSLKTKDKYVKKGEKVSISLEESPYLAAIQFSLQHDGLSFLGLEKHETQSASEAFEFEGKHLLTGLSTSGKMDFSLQFQAEQSGWLHEFLHFENDPTPSLGFYENGEEVRLELGFEKVQSTMLQNVQVVPNPATDIATLYFDLLENEAVDIQVFDALGRMVFSDKINGEKGLNRVVLPLEYIPDGINFIHAFSSHSTYQYTTFFHSKS